MKPNLKQSNTVQHETGSRTARLKGDSVHRLVRQKIFITPKSISNISGQLSLDLAVTTGLATALKTLTADDADHTDKNI
jgi:hypothetical protein